MGRGWLACRGMAAVIVVAGLTGAAPAAGGVPRATGRASVSRASRAALSRRGLVPLPFALCSVLESCCSVTGAGNALASGVLGDVLGGVSALLGRGVVPSLNIWVSGRCCAVIAMRRV
jgi:hypothetical protein